MLEYYYLPHITLILLTEIALLVVMIPWVLLNKKESTAAVAWCLVVILLPALGAIFFMMFGYQHVNRLKKKREHRESFEDANPPATPLAKRGRSRTPEPIATWNNLGALGLRVGAFPVCSGNEVTLYHDTGQAFAELCDAIRAARHHVHLEYFIVQPDETGQHLLQLLTEKAKKQVEVRLLYDYLGSRRLKRKLLKPLWKAGGKSCSFRLLRLLRRRFQVNLRNHRKLTVVDGRIGFTGGMNIGDEYLGRCPQFPYWRDSFLRLEGPAVAGLQRVFTEDWDFAYEEPLDGPAYYPELAPVGSGMVQVVESGPDQEAKTIRELIFAAITGARERVWIATPYFVPDAGLLDALRLAAHKGVDVRILCPHRPDHYMSYFAGCYYWTDMLNAGARVYQYTKGMMHAKFMTADGQWGLVSSANLDNRSLHLNFEAGCALHSPELVRELEDAFRKDLAESILLDPEVYATRPFATRLAENACRLFSPVL